MTAERMNNQEAHSLSWKGERMFKRLNALNPHPDIFTEETLYDYYLECLPPDVREWLEMSKRIQAKYPFDRSADKFSLTNVSSAYQERIHMPIELTEREAKQGEAGLNIFRLTFNFSVVPSRILDTQQFPQVSNIKLWLEPDHPVAKLLTPWVKRQYKLQSIIDNASRVFGILTDHCRTPGQWKRVMPAVVLLLTGHQQRLVKNQLRASPIPRNLSMRWVDKVPQISELLTKCVALPEYEGNRLVYLSSTHHRENP